MRPIRITNDNERITYDEAMLLKKETRALKNDSKKVCFYFLSWRIYFWKWKYE